MKNVALVSTLALALSPALAQAGGEVVAPPPPAPQPAPVAPVVPAPAPAPAPVPAPAPEREGGPYAALYGGASWLDDADVDFDEFGDDAEVEFDTGWIAGGAVGYGFDAGTVEPRVELDVAYRRNGLDRVAFGEESTSDVDGDISAISGMANVWLDVPVTDNLKPYAGGGVGAAHVMLDDAGVDGADFEDDEDTVFAWQLGAGVAYEFTPSLAATVDYRWFNTDDPKFNVDGDDLETEYGTHNVMAGIRYKF